MGFWLDHSDATIDGRFHLPGEGQQRFMTLGVTITIILWLVLVFCWQLDAHTRGDSGDCLFSDPDNQPQTEPRLLESKGDLLLMGFLIVTFSVAWYLLGGDLEIGWAYAVPVVLIIVFVKRLLFRNIVSANRKELEALRQELDDLKEQVGPKQEHHE